MSSCANCDKGEGSDLKACTCKLVKYCNRECQIAHRSQHKKECRKRAAELHEEALFKQPPIKEDCPICMIPLPTIHSGTVYSECCGKFICSGCVNAVQYAEKDVDFICPFCRTPKYTSDEEFLNRIMKRVEMNEITAINQLGLCYWRGENGVQRNFAKAVELWQTAVNLGSSEELMSISDCAAAHFNLGCAYINGNGVDKDEKKGKVSLGNISNWGRFRGKGQCCHVGRTRRQHRKGSEAPYDWSSRWGRRIVGHDEKIILSWECNKRSIWKGFTSLPIIPRCDKE